MAVLSLDDDALLLIAQTCLRGELCFTNRLFAVCRRFHACFHAGGLKELIAQHRALDYIATKDGLQHGCVCRAVLESGLHVWDAEYAWDATGSCGIGVVDAGAWDNGNTNTVCAWGWQCDYAASACYSGFCGNRWVRSGVVTVGERKKRGTCTIIADMEKRRLRISFGDGEEHDLGYELPARVRPWVRLNNNNNGHRVTLSNYRRRAVGAVSPQLPLVGPLRKKSEWLGRWNVRAAAVRSGELVWSGGSQPGVIALDRGTSIRMDGDRLIVQREGRTLFFRAAAGGPRLEEWRDALVAARMRYLYLGQSAPQAAGVSL